MPRQAPYIEFGPYRVHPDQGLFHEGVEIRVTPKALAVLYALASLSPRVVTKSELFAAIWSDRVVTDAALSTCIRELRRALEDDARRPRYIETLHRRGFRLRAPCTAIPLDLLRETSEHARANEADARALEPAPPGAGPSGFGRGSIESVALVEAQLDDDPTLAKATGEPSSRSSLEAQPSIVVLSFESIGDAESGEVLARGLVHDITARVARSRTMLVIARGTAFQFRSGLHDVRTIGEKLRVRYVVQGAVQVHRGRLKVSVALADAPTRREIWTEQYDRPLADFMLLQEEIAQLIVAAIESEVAREEVRRALLMPSSNLHAWSAYHRGIHYMYRFRHQDCEQAEHWFRRSIDMEPGVPRPYAGLSFVHFERAFLNFDRDRSIAIGKAFDYASQSLSIDPRDPMGHWALSRAHLLRGELEAAKRSVEVAIELNPSYAIAQYSLGWVALQLGENQLCRDRVAFARRLSPYDPLSFAMLGVYALNLALMGRTAEAAVVSLRSIQQANAHYQAFAFAAVTHALDGQLDKAAELLGRAQATTPDYGLEDFLAVFRFQLERDIGRVSEAFEAMRRRLR